MFREVGRVRPKNCPTSHIYMFLFCYLNVANSNRTHFSVNRVDQCWKTQLSLPTCFETSLKSKYKAEYLIPDFFLLIFDRWFELTDISSIEIHKIIKNRPNSTINSLNLSKNVLNLSKNALNLSKNALNLSKMH